MANTLPIVLKRTSISGRLPEAVDTANTRYIEPGELSINLADQKVHSSNGSVIFEVGSNVSSLRVESIVANGSTGSNGQALISNGTHVYWDNNPGFTGSQGYTGSRGGFGYTGSRGADGYVGADGYTGSQGERGYTGSTGFTGSKGDTGYVGSQGAIGYTGSQADATGLIAAHEAAADPHPQYTTPIDVASLTGDVHGIVNRAESQLSYDIYTNEFTIAPTGSSWQYYYHGNLHTVNTSLSITLSNTTGARFIRINPNTEVLIEGGPIPNFADDAILSYIYYNAEANKVLILGDERHGYKRDTTWHSAQHLNVGTIWRSGGSLSYTLDDQDNIGLGVSTPLVIADEDLIHTIQNSATPSADYEQTLYPSASLEVLYLDGSHYTSTDPSVVPWVAGSFNARYNHVINGFGSLEDANDGEYITYWLIATNDIRRPVKLVMGRASHASIGEAYAEEFQEYGLSFAEQVFMYQIVLHTSSAYTNDSKVAIAAVRKVTSKTATSAASVTATYHNYLTGRDALDTHPIAAITGLTDALNAKQDTLISNTNIKTIKGQSILGSGDINEVGYTGSIGYTGSAGSIGYTGSRGADGYVGADGFTGSRGYTGSQGYTGSKGDTPESTVYQPQSLTQTGGVYVSGAIGDVQAFNDGNAYVLTDGSGTAPAWYITFDFTGIVSFNQLDLNVNYTASSGHTIYIQLYNNTTLSWDNIGSYTGLGSYNQFQLGVISGAPYINAGTVSVRLYHSNQGNTSHQTSIDYIALVDSISGGQGPRGLTGYTGSRGFTGSQGDTGFTGSQGDLGYTGSIGFTGSQGTVGFTGSQGSNGFTGSQGNIGYTGSQGFTGSQGNIGYTGSQGAIGYTGSLGYTGSQGNIGYTGSLGYTGSKGTTTISDTEPSSPSNGDTWWNSVDGVRYVYYSDGTSSQWVQESAVGPIGYTGSAGRLTVPIATFFTTTPTASELLMMYTAVESFAFANNFSGSAGSVGTNPTSSFVLTVQKNGSNVGNVTISTGGSFTFNSGNTIVSMASGDQLRIVAPSVADATIQNVSLTLKGSI